MLSVIIPALNAERHLPSTLTALVPAAVDGIIREVIIVDGGSADRTRSVADHAGADFLVTAPGRGSQLAEGAARAKFPWLLFLHADTVLQDGWEREAADFMHRVDVGEQPRSAAAFRFRLDDNGLAPRTLEAIVRVRCAALRLPYGDQGLLISRRLYDEVGGYNALPIMEDVDIVRRLGRSRMTLLNANATTSAERYRREGYLARTLRNQTCLALYSAGLPIAKIQRLYGVAHASR
ncbi:MAG: glycosyltransferase [Hyphomicrobium sp.]|nr:glycosyltransferase [Hyphomicrobium sp.]